MPGTKLSLDFLIPSLPLAVEIQGTQHNEHIPHFHGNRHGFVKQIQRDIKKKHWLENNNIPLIELDYNDSNNWLDQIRNFFRQTE